MNYLFVHQNFPAQFRHIARNLADNNENKVFAMGDKKNIHSRGFNHPNVNLVDYPFDPPVSKETHNYLRSYDRDIRRGQSVARASLHLKEQGFYPDVVIAHPGWGEALFLKDIFPNARHILHCEYYYHAKNADVGFDPEFPITLDSEFRIRIRNSTQLQCLAYCDAGISPTLWQRSRYPADFQPKIQLVHEGINTNLAKPDPSARFSKGKLSVDMGSEVVTYVSRNLEPYRGFHSFIRALPTLQKLRPNAHVLVVGGDDVSYGQKPPSGKTYRKYYCDEVRGDVDWSRVHFLGKLPYGEYLKVLQISKAHVYLTYPFILSWSMLEAMSAGCLVIGSSTPPVMEVIEHEKNGLLVNFYEPESIAQTVAKVLEKPDDYFPLRQAARKTIIENYDLASICLPKWTSLLS